MGLSKKERIRKYGEVFTPEWLVKDMLDMLGRASTERDAFGIHFTYLEPACGEGVFLIEILRRKLERCKSQDDILTALQSLYGIDIQENNVEKSRAALLQMVRDSLDPQRTEEAVRILQENIVAGNFLTKRLNTGEVIPWLSEYLNT